MPTSNIYIYIYIYIFFFFYIYIYIYIYISWSSATGSQYSTEFSVQNGSGNSHVMGPTVAMDRSIEFCLLGFYTLCLKSERDNILTNILCEGVNM